MRSATLTSLVFLCFLVSPALSQDDREVSRSIPETEDPAFPESIRADPTPEELEKKALEAMTSGHYKKARRLFEKLLAQRPNDPRALFNLACTLSRLGELDQAALQLEASWTAGLRFPQLLRTDPDLEALRESRKGSALIERLLAEEARRERLQGVPQFFEAPTLAGLRVVAPKPLEEGRSYPVVLALHGHGGSAEPYAGMFEAFESSLDAIVVAPYGPYPVALERGHGYAWYPPLWLYRQASVAEGLGHPESDLESVVDEVSRRYVMMAIEAVSRSHPVDPEQIFLLGHSEGGGLAYDLALERPDLFRGVIVIAAPFREADGSSDRLAAAAGQLTALICHSPEDPQVGIEHAEMALEAFHEAGVDSRLLRYRGGHGITADLIHQIAKWIRKVVRPEQGK